MRIKFRNPVLRLTQDQRYQEYLQDRLTGSNIIQIRSIIVEDPPLVRTVTVPKTYIKSPRGHPGAWIVAGVASTVLSIVPPTLIEKIPAFDIRVPNPAELTEHEPKIVAIDLEIPTTKQVPREIEVPVEVSKQVEVQTQNEAGEIQADPVAIEQTSELVQQIVSDGGTIASMEFSASSSDEWGQLSRSLGLPNAGNLETAQQRAQAVASSLSLSLATRGQELGQYQLAATEDIWAPEEIMNLEALAQGLGFESSQELYDSYKADRNSVATGLADYLDVKLGEKRGTNITISYLTKELEKKTVLVTVPDTKTFSIDLSFPTEPDPFDLRIFPIFIPPLGRRYEDREKLFPQSHTEDIEDQAIIKLFPEAKTLNGKLRSDSWRDTRKYDFLLKHDRIKYVHRLDYNDKSGKSQTLRIAFVDHVPSADALMAAVKVAQEAAQVQGGKIGNKLDLIALFPQTRSDLSDEQELGLGIDEKLSRGVLGLAIPGIGLVEATYDPHASYEELISSGNMVHTLRHEILGHFTDLNDTEPTLRRVHNIPNGYSLSTPWKGIIGDLYFHHLKLELLGAPKTFDIVRSVDGQQPGQKHSNEGELFEHSVVQEIPDDGSVVSVNLRRFTDAYAETHPLEYWAQSVAYALAETAIDPSTTYGTWLLPPEVAARLGGYRPDKRVIEIVHKTLGTMASRDGTAFPLDFQTRPDFTHTGGMGADREFQKMVDEAKERVLPKASDLINVVTAVRPLNLTSSPSFQSESLSPITSPRLEPGLSR